MSQIRSRYKDMVDRVGDFFNEVGLARESPGFSDWRKFALDWIARSKALLDQQAAMQRDRFRDVDVQYDPLVMTWE